MLDVLRWCVQDVGVPLRDAVMAASATPAQALALSDVRDPCAPDCWPTSSWSTTTQVARRAGAAILGSAPQRAPPRSVAHNRRVNRHAAVAATSPLAAQAGIDIVHGGGNAVDGAIAAMTVAMATEPSVVSPLGGAFVNVWPDDGPPVVIDGNVEMPGRGLPRERFGTGFREIETSYGGGMTVYAGHASVATPGSFAAFGVAHDRFGAAPWSALMGPATSAARDGFPLGKTSADYLALTHDTIYGWDRQTRDFLNTPGGEAHPTGAILRSTDLASSLEAVGARGWGDLYTGDLAEQIALDMEQRGGLVTRTDLAGYRAVERQPLMSSLADWQVAANAPPSIGGPVLTALLVLLAGRTDRTPSDLIEIQRQVLGYRHGHLDASQDLMASGHELVKLVTARGIAGLSTSASTAHVSVVDSDGLGLRDHRIERIRFRRNGPRHRADAQQLPRRAGAQPPRAARPAPGHPARLQHAPTGPAIGAAPRWRSAAPAPTGSPRR